MALLALSGEPRGDVVRRVGLLVSVLVAGIALDRKSLELPNRFALVAVGTIQPSMSSRQGKPVIVLLHSLQDNAPTLHRVTLFAVRTHLTAMDVGMAIGTVRSRIRKHGLGVALGAGHCLVQTTQRVLRFVVIEFRNGPDGFPSRRGMTVLTRNIEVAVGTARHRRATRLPEPGCRTAARDQAYRNQENGCRRE